MIENAKNKCFSMSEGATIFAVSGFAAGVLQWASGVGAWPIALSVFLSLVLVGLIFRRRGRGRAYCGAVFVLVGLFLGYQFREIIFSEAEDFSVVAVIGAMMIGGVLMALDSRGTVTAVLVSFLLFYGGSSMISKSLLGGGEVCWVYEAGKDGAGRLVAAEPCYVAEGPGGELVLVPRGYLGILPLDPNGGVAGKKVGPYLIVGVLEMGGVVENVGDSEFAHLDFSMVSPIRGSGVGVVRNPLLRGGSAVAGLSGS